MKIEINITEADIKKAINKLQGKEHIAPSCCCPVYQAFKRMGFNVESVKRHFGYGYYVNIIHNNQRYNFDLPQPANDFIFAFDNSLSFKTNPASFTMDIPQQFTPKK